LINGAFYTKSNQAPKGQRAVFHGFSLNAFQEEQVCAIQTRIERTDRNVGCIELVVMLRQAFMGSEKDKSFTSDDVARVLKKRLIQFLSEDLPYSPSRSASYGMPLR
jgi:hypothetical protein